MGFGFWNLVSGRAEEPVQPAAPGMEDPRVVFEVCKANNCHPDWLKEHGEFQAEVAEAHRALEARKTTGCTILTL